jgi:hypothetical protein
MSHPYHWIQPLPGLSSDIFAVFDLTRSFHEEVEYRESHERYCQWYRSVAMQHQHELKTMQKDPNLLGWLIRGC